MARVVELKHGAGGSGMSSLLEEILGPVMDDDRIDDSSVPLARLDDAGVAEGLALSTDTYTVRPLRFPGGDIGTVAYSGTVNDLSVMGARPVGLSSAVLVSAGFPYEELKEIMESMFQLAAGTGIPILSGDTKVVEAGAVDGLYINTAGMGVPSPHLESNEKVLAGYGGKRRTRWLSDSNLRDGDVIICSGTLGDHGVALMSLREGYGFHASVQSDAAPLHGMISSALEVGGITACKDPTRGGLANLLNEWRDKSGAGIVIEGSAVPVREPVRSACDIMGMDPMSIGNEGKAVFAVVPEMAEEVLKALRGTTEGRDAAIIGRVSAEERYVVLETEVGGRRILEAPIGDPVPRIC